MKKNLFEVVVIATDGCLDEHTIANKSYLVCALTEKKAKELAQEQFTKDYELELKIACGYMLTIKATNTETEVLG